MTILLTESLRVLAVLFSAWIVHTEKLYFARFINTEQDLFTYHAHTIINEKVAKCVEKCKSSNECKYINYHVASHVCYLIGESAETHVDITDRVEKKKGYVFGNKADWILKIDSGCLICNGDGTCKAERTPNNACALTGCKPPDSRPDAIATGNMFDVGNSIKYECLGNNKIVVGKNHISTCLGNGTLSVTDFQCLYVFKCTGRSTGWRYGVNAACSTCVAECMDDVDQLACSCTEYLKRFMILPNYRIKANNIGVAYGIQTREDCMASCRSKPGCKSADYYPKGLYCYFNNVMPHEVEPLRWETTNLLMRQCDSCNIIRK